MNSAYRKKRKIWFFLSLFLFCAVPVGLWAMITQPLLFAAGKDTRMNEVEVDPQRLKAHVEMLSVKLRPRDAGHPKNLDRVADYIRNEFTRAGGKIEDQPFQVYGQTYRNVRALFGPETGECIVIGAHYDSAGELPAADDNASGVAGLIELAHLLGSTSLKTPVELVAYTLEEPPFFRTEHMGSAVHAASLKRQSTPVRLMVSLEMIGYFTDAPDSQQFPLKMLKLFYPSTGNFIAVVGKLGQGAVVRRVKNAMRSASLLPVYSINAPSSLPGIDFSDHLNYWNEGYNAVMVTDTSFYRNNRYHTERDTPDTLDYKRMAMVVKGVYALVLSEAA